VRPLLSLEREDHVIPEVVTNSVQSLSTYRVSFSVIAVAQNEIPIPRRELLNTRENKTQTTDLHPFQLSECTGL
jgi:hypothetical protein